MDQTRAALPSVRSPVVPWDVGAQPRWSALRNSLVLHTFFIMMSGVEQHIEWISPMLLREHGC